MPPRAKDSLKGLSWQEKARKKIQTPLLINRLQKIANGEVEAQSYQVTAALGLLRKTLPDLTENETKLTGDLTVQVVQFSNNPPAK